MPQVSARIVVAQAGNPAPGGYTHGSRDNLLLDALCTLTNLDNAGVTSWAWEIYPAVGLVEGDYSASGKESATLTLTPPASTGYGDLAVRLTVRGDPLPGGRPNVAVAEALLGVRAELSGYPAGLPIVHPKESTLGGVLTLSAVRGAIGRLAEAIRAIRVAGLGGGGASPSVSTIDVSMLDSAAFDLTTEQAAATVIRIEGTPPDDPEIRFPATEGRSWILENATTSGLFLAQVTGGSRVIYLLQGQRRLVYVRGGELYAPDEKALIGEVTVSLIRGSAGTYDTATLRLPPGTRLSRHSVLGVVAEVGGTSTLSAGTASGGAQVQTAQSAPAVGAVLGEDPAHWGTDLAATGSKYYAAGQELWLRQVCAAPISAGSVRILVEGCLL